MGRRDTPAAGGLDAPAPEAAKAWQAVRRALGRLAGRARVREVAAPERMVSAAVLAGALALPPPALAADAAWRPSAPAVRLAAVPQAGSGLRESDLLPSVRSALSDCVLPPPAVLAVPAPCTEVGRIGSAGLAWEAGVSRLPDEFLRLPPQPVRVSAVPLLPLPRTRPLQAARLSAPVKALRLPPRPGPRVLWGGDAVLGRMALTRRGREAPPGEAFAAEGRRLAEAAGLPSEDVALLGVYPDVPILAVRRIVVEDEGRLLRLWLKPEVLRARARPHLITLLVGRQNSTGKMLQAAL